MLQALIWFVFFLIPLVIVFSLSWRGRETLAVFLFVFGIFLTPTFVCGLWLLWEVVVLLWPYAMGVK